ncbi:T7SS effector LXG polymorphic toxin [Streptococcus ferus]|uniref:Membrane protein n=2 Tax=Streptococcus ferus TaxID=1345 RepID=A0A2X3W504_9STRE|nr:T7SS effector LXG polymorphic toxin [Streptococcus ferus]SQF39436.1 membrane protein [Streptococcus ferus]
MVKMVLGSSDSQATSVAALADSYTAAFESLISAFDNLANEDKLSGSAYTNIKSYGNSVVTPLVKAFILLADAAKADVQKLPDEYRAQVGGEDLDEETLTAQISAYATTIEANQTSATSLGKTEPMTDAVQASINSLNDAVASDTAAKAELEEKLRKLLEYNAQSSGFFSDIASLESAVTTGISQLQAGVTSFNGTFTLPSKKDLAWTKTVNSQWEDREAYLEVVDKVKKGKALKAKDVKAIERYQKKHPNVKIDQSILEAKDNYEAKKVKKETAKVSKAKSSNKVTDYSYYPGKVDTKAYQKREQQRLAKREATASKKLDAKTKKKIDRMSYQELVKAYPRVTRTGLGIDFEYLSMSDKQKLISDYADKRYRALVAKLPVNPKSQTFMEDYAGFIKRTGKDPFTGQTVSKGTAAMAKNYGWVKSGTTLTLALVNAKTDFDQLRSLSRVTKASVTVPKVKLSTDKTATSVEAILKQNGTTSKSFLNLTDADSVLSPKQIGIVRDVRVQIGLPESGTKMAKVIPAKYVEGIVAPDSKRNTVSGFVSVDSHSASLKTLDEVFEGNRLDYQNTPYSPGADDTYAKINFTLDSKMRLDIPLREPKVGEYPFTGRGFTGSKEIVLPEYELRKGANYHYQHGDTIGVYDSKSGSLLKQYMYDGEFNTWMQRK